MSGSQGLLGSMQGEWQKEQPRGPLSFVRFGISNFPRYCLRRWKNGLSQWLMTYRIEAQHQNVRFARPISWLIDDMRMVFIGQWTCIGPFCEIVVLASHVNSRVPGELRIGTATVIGGMCNIRAAGGAIRIGNDCMIGQNVSLIAANHQAKKGSVYWKLRWDEEKTGIAIGDNCWIGAGVTILPGVSIGNNAVIAAGSVVTKDVPADEIWGNIPARKIRNVQCDPRE